MDFANRVIRRKAIAFLISDFCLPGDFDISLETLRPKLQITGRHHDLVAVSVHDPREQELPDIGLITIEDSETGNRWSWIREKQRSERAFPSCPDPGRKTCAIRSDRVVWTCWNLPRISPISLTC